MFYFKNKERLSKKGFTILELLISIAIIGFITGVVVFNQKDFTDQISIANTVSDIELEIRQAQAYGVGVREFSTGSNEFDVAYGASFNLISAQNGANNFFVIFTDRSSQNNYYDGSHAQGFFDCVYDSASECFSFNRLKRSNQISSICVINSGASETCAPTINRVDILFKRPSPEAIFTFFNPTGNIVSYPNAIGTRIEVISPKGKKMSVYVYKTGQISVQ